MTKAEQLADQLRVMRHDVICLTEREVLAESIAELLRLAQMEERVKELEDALRLCRHHMYAHASNTPDGAFDALCLALDKN